MPVETLKVTKDVQALLAVVGQQLRAARTQHQESIDDVAAALHTTAARIRRAEAGKPSVALGMYAMLLRRYHLQHQLLAIGASEEAPAGKALAKRAAGVRSPKPHPEQGHGRG